MIRAYPKLRRPGHYYLDSDRNGETYRDRELIKAAGGKWDGRHWAITEDQRQSLGYPRMVLVAGTTSCNIRETAMVPESDAVLGKSIRIFCGHCDSYGPITVEEIVRE
jgi:hypothetical protein